MVAPGNQFGAAHRPLQDQAMFGLAARLGDRRVEQRLIRDDAVDLDAARGRQDCPRPGGVDPGRQLVRGKPAEHHRMHGADAGAGQHRHRRLRHHRHIDQHPVALADAETGQRAGEPRHLVAQLVIAETSDLAGDRAVPDQRRARATTGCDMAVERVPAGVQPGARKPAVKWRPAAIEHPIPAAFPIDCLSRLGPELLRLFDRAAIGCGISGRHRL